MYNELSQVYTKKPSVYKGLHLGSQKFRIKTLVMLNVFMYYTPTLSFIKLLTCCIQVLSMFSIRVENSVDPDQLASLEAS